MEKSFVIKGNICQTTSPKELDLHENAYAVCVDGVSKGIFDILACMIFVKRDKSLSYKALDKLSIVLDCVVCFVAIPFMTLVTAFLQITMSGDELIYQIYLCIPALTAFTVAASIVLRRIRFTKAGFFVPFIGPVLFVLPLIFE